MKISLNDKQELLNVLAIEMDRDTICQIFSEEVEIFGIEFVHSLANGYYIYGVKLENIPEIMLEKHITYLETKVLIESLLGNLSASAANLDLRKVIIEKIDFEAQKNEYLIREKVVKNIETGEDMDQSVGLTALAKLLQTVEEKESNPKFDLTTEDGILRSKLQEWIEKNKKLGIKIPKHELQRIFFHFLAQQEKRTSVKSK